MTVLNIARKALQTKIKGNSTIICIFNPTTSACQFQLAK